MDFTRKLDQAQNLSDLFELVKRAVEAVLGRTRAGLMLALADLGNHPQGFLGAFYPVASNVIVMNKVPLLRIQETNPALYKPYAFYVLLHEYLHSLEFVDAFMLIFIGAGAIIAGGNLLLVAFAHGLAIGVMASAFGRISGGHFNPAVTLGALVGRQISARLAAVYWASQLLGALSAAV